MKRRKVTYPVARTHTKGAPRAGAGPEVAVVRPNLVAIDITAGAGRANLKVGGRVRINGTGLYAGEEATIERLVARRHPDGRGADRRRRDSTRPDDRPRPDRRGTLSPSDSATMADVAKRKAEATEIPDDATPADADGCRPRRLRAPTASPPSSSTRAC